MATAEAKLYEIGDRLEAVTARIIENDGVISEELEEELDAVEGAFREKVERTALAVQELTRKAEVCGEEADRLKARASSFEKSADSLKEYLRHQLRRQGVERVDGDRVSVRRQMASRPKIRWNRPDELPPVPFRRYRIKAKLDGDDGERAEQMAELGADVEAELDGQAAYREWKDGELPEGFEVERSEFAVIW